MNPIKRWLMKRWGVHETEFQCACGRTNKPLITPTLIRPHPGDSPELRAWKMRQWSKIKEAEKWYAERDGSNQKTRRVP